MEFHAARTRQGTAPTLAWGRCGRRSVWAPPSGGERRGLPLLRAAAGFRGEPCVEGRGGVRDDRDAAAAAVAGAVSGGTAADARRSEGGGMDGRGKEHQASRRGVVLDGAPVERAGAGDAGAWSADGVRGVPGSVVTRDGCDVGTKRPAAAPPADHLPPKRRLVSAIRRFPPGCGRNAAAPLGRADGSRFRAGRAGDNSDALGNAAPAPSPRPASYNAAPASRPHSADFNVAPAASRPRSVACDAAPALRRPRSAACDAAPASPRPRSAACDTVPAPPRPDSAACDTAPAPPRPDSAACDTAIDPPRPRPAACDTAPAPPRPRSAAACDDGLLPGAESLGSACASGFMKLSATDGAGSEAKGGRHVPGSRLLAKRRAVSARRTFPPGCGRVAVQQPAVQEPVTVKPGRADDGFSVLEEKVADGDCGVSEGKVADGDCGVSEEKVTDGDGSAADKESTDVATQCEDEELEEGEFRPGKVHPVAQELLGSQVSVTVTMQQSAACELCEHRTSVPAISVVEASASASSDEKMSASRIQSGEKNNSARSSSHIATESLSDPTQEHLRSSHVASEGPSQEHLRGTRVSEIATMDLASAAVAGRGSVQGAKMKGKLMFTPRKTVKPPNLIQKSVVDTQRAPFSENKGKENKLGRHMGKNEIQDAAKSSGKILSTQGKEGDTVVSSFGPRKKTKVKDPATLPVKLIPMWEVDSKEKLNGKVTSKLEGDDILRGVAIRHGTIELYLKNSSHVPSGLYGVQGADMRSKVMMMRRRFEVICTTIAQSVDARCLKIKRIDLAAEKALKELPGFSKPGPCVGNVPGVEVGDSFHYRVQLAIVGLHRPYQGGIDWTKDANDNLVAVSVVASGGYPDDLSSSGELVYTGSGGELAGRNAGGDQKLKRGNLALRNCIERMSPVRVIRGFKGQNEGGSLSRAREIITFTYDGLYYVVDCWKEGHPGSKVFKYRLKRIPGQPELSYGRKTGIMS